MITHVTSFNEILRRMERQKRLKAHPSPPRPQGHVTSFLRIYDLHFAMKMLGNSTEY